MGSCTSSKKDMSEHTSYSQSKNQERTKDDVRQSVRQMEKSGHKTYFDQFIDTNDGRKRLNLKRKGLIDEDIHQMMKGQKHLRDVEEINLQNNFLTEIGCFELLRGGNWDKLKVLNLSINRIREFESLQKLPKLQILYLQRNPLSESTKKYLQQRNFKNGVFLIWEQ